MSKLQGKVAVITGANSGIGLAAAKLFATEGARVFMTARRKMELDTAVAAVGNNAFGVQSDVSRLTDLDHLFATVKRHAGAIDVLFANAGAESLPLLDPSPKNTSIKRFRRMFEELFSLSRRHSR